MAGPTRNARMCMVQPPRTRNRIRVGLFAKFKDKKPTAPQILGMLREFNSAQGTSLRVIRPQIAELVANPPSMFPRQMPAMAVSLLGQSGLATHYPFGEGTFPTSSIIAYPGRVDGLPREMGLDCGDGATMVFRTGEYAGGKSAVLAPNVSADSFVRDGNLLIFAFDVNPSIGFPCFPESGTTFLPRFNASNETKEAFTAVGGVPNSRSGKQIRRVRGAHAGFIGRFGKHDDHASKTELLMDTSPSEGYDCALVEVPEGDLGKFMAHAPSSRE